MKTERLDGLRREVNQAVTAQGLDPYPVEFGVVAKERMDEISAYNGFPERFPHWKFGMKYDLQNKRSRYGGMNIYELVVNSNPALAYLREENSTVQNKAIMAHVYAHSDFFKNNKWFTPTREDMIKVTREHGNRVEQMMETHGVSKVESFIDKVLSLQFSIDQHLPYKGRRDRDKADSKDEVEKIPVRRDYMEEFINPRDWVAEKGKDSEEPTTGPSESEVNLPTSDLLGFFAESGDLSPWQKDVISIVREESYYFAPQLMTKVMNEGWAAYWQSKIMNEVGIADGDEFVNHADMYSRVLSGQGVNPYSLGKRVWEDVKERWDKGRHGSDWEECSDRERLKSWDEEEGDGLEKVFSVRRNLTDGSFIDEYFTEEVLEDLNLFTYEWLPKTGDYHVTSRALEAVKKKLMLRYTNLGRPTIKVKNGNYENTGELLLIHEFNGVNLHLSDASDVLENIYGMWNRPVNLETVVREPPKKAKPEVPEKGPTPKASSTPTPGYHGLRLRFDGDEFQKEKMDRDEFEDLIYDMTDYDTVPADWSY